MSYSMQTSRKRLRSFAIRHFNRFEPWRWVVIAVVGLGLFWVEAYEYFRDVFHTEPFHFVEVFLYAILLVGSGLFVELFVRLNRIHKRMVKILEYKHNLSLEFSLINNWETLTTRLARLPASIVNVDEAYLMMNNPISGRFEPISHWTLDERTPAAGGWDPTVGCERCFEKSSGDQNSIHLCRKDNEILPYFAYSLRIDNSWSTLLKFRLRPGLRLTPDEEKIFNNVVDEIAIAIHAGQDHRRISELQSAEVAMTERRMISAYLHDQIGQNLGYLHLKLDQLNTNEYIMRSQEVREDIEHLREIANESYDMVRDILKKMQPETIPHLTNLLKEYATQVSRMAHFTLNFHCMGAPVQLLPDIQQTIFYAFHEILSNVQTHSRASSVDALVTWSDTCLDICVADNGVGFDPESVPQDEHFGLEILRERIAHLKGQLLIDSSLHLGTSVSIAVPILSQMRVSYERTGNERSRV